jgi:hypothetical protein
MNNYPWTQADETPALDQFANEYGAELEYFISVQCEGKQYDSCKNSPCRFSSSSGCLHPEHPKNKLDPKHWGLS